MPAPYDYSGALSPVDPGQALMQGLATGQKFAQVQQQEQQRQQMAQRAKQFQVDFESVIDNKDPRAITDLLIRYPEQKQILETVGQRFSAEEKQQKMNQSIELIGLSLSGKNDEVIGFYENQADVLEKAGRPEEAANSRLQAQQFREDPDAARMQQQIIIAAQDPDKFLQNMDQIFETRKKYVESQVEAAKAQSLPRQKLRDAGIIGDPIKTTDADKFANGLTMYRTDIGESYGVDVRGNVLQGEEYAQALKESQDFEAASVGQIAGARESGKLGAQVNVKAAIAGDVAASESMARIGADQGLKTYQELGKVRLSIGNLDQAIAAVRNGANTGYLESRLPNWFGPSVELANAQAQMGLDIIGMTTFGALSADELKLALNTAFPTDLQEDELLDFLLRKKAAQVKVQNELEKMSLFLMEGNSLLDWIKQEQGRIIPTRATDPMSLSEEEQANIDFVERMIGNQ